MNDQQYDNTNRGAIFVNDKQGNDKRPDRKGSLNVEGVEYWISGWIKTSQKGDKFMSLSVERKDAHAAPRAATPNNSRITDQDIDDAGADIPF